MVHVLVLNNSLTATVLSFEFPGHCDHPLKQS